MIPVRPDGTNPKQEPRFGDVFECTATGLERMQAMFIQGDKENWVALDLPEGGITDGYIGVEYPEWRFVDNVMPYALGGPMATTTAEYERIEVELRSRLSGMTSKELSAVLAKALER